MKNVITAILGIVGVSTLVCLYKKHREREIAEHLQRLIHEQMDESNL